MQILLARVYATAPNLESMAVLLQSVQVFITFSAPSKCFGAAPPLADGTTVKNKADSVLFLWCSVRKKCERKIQNCI